MRRAVLVWGGLYAGVNLALLVAGAIARRAGKDRRAHGAGWPDVHNLRVVGGSLVVGGQPTREQYRELASHAVTAVVDLRAGGRADPIRDDPDHLRSLGLRHAAVPIPDGHAPTAAQVDEILGRIRQADGLTYVHCGAGVGRSGSVAAAYLAGRGQAPSVAEQIATGPPSLEQVWFVAACRAGAIGCTPAFVGAASRLIDAPRVLYGQVARRR